MSWGTQGCWSRHRLSHPAPVGGRAKVFLFFFHQLQTWILEYKRIFFRDGGSWWMGTKGWNNSASGFPSWELWFKPHSHPHPNIVHIQVETKLRLITAHFRFGWIVNDTSKRTWRFGKEGFDILRCGFPGFPSSDLDSTSWPRSYTRGTRFLTLNVDGLLGPLELRLWYS